MDPSAHPELASLLAAGSTLPFGERHDVETGDGARLHAVMAGAGLPLVLTHGALMSLDAWAPLWQPLVDAGHRVIAYDLRGHGRSSLGRSGFGIEAYAQDLATVLDHFDVRRGVVVGHSTGGIGALTWSVTSATEAASRLAGQVFVSTTATGLGDRVPTRLMAPIVFSGLIHRVLQRRRVGSVFTRTLFGVDPDPNLVEFARRIMAAAPRRTTIDAPKAVLRFDLRDRLHRVEVPTLILYGDKDRSLGPGRAETLAGRIAGATLQCFPDAGHLVILERTDQITKAVTDFARHVRSDSD